MKQKTDTYFVMLKSQTPQSHFFVKKTKKTFPIDFIADYNDDCSINVSVVKYSKCCIVKTGLFFNVGTESYLY